jgi:hypothetical protein
MRNFLFKTLFLALLVFPQLSSAEGYEEDYFIIWKYVFHLEEKSGVLAVNSSEKFAYDTIPMEWGGGMEDGAYYGEIVSGRGVSLKKVWFTPTLQVEAQNKKIIDLEAPYFANARDITFYKKDSTKLFSISLRASSFCNDDGKCNIEVGENYGNCANDCVRPDDAPIFTPTPPQTPPTPTTPNPTIATPPTESAPPIVTDPEIVRTTETPSVAEQMGGTVSLVGGVFLILTAVVGLIYIKKKNTASL